MSDKKHPILKGACYVAHQGLACIPDLFGGERVQLNFYPETGLTALERQVGVLYVDSIVTECVKLVSMYNNSDVYVWENGEWVNPRFQTFGCSFNILETRILKFNSTIPSRIIGGHEQGRVLTDKIKAIYN